MSESLIEYGDDWSKIEERTIEFFAMMICCADHYVKLDNYSDIDEMRKADDFEDTMRGYRVLANKKIAELKLGLDSSLELISIIQELCTVILQYDFKDVEDKVDFCMMLNEMDNKDLAFFKEVFTALENGEMEDYLGRLEEENEQLKQRVSKLECLLQLDKLHKEVEEGKMDKFVELKLND